MGGDGLGIKARYRPILMARPSVPRIRRAATAFVATTVGVGLLVAGWVGASRGVDAGHALGVAVASASPSSASAPPVASPPAVPSLQPPIETPPPGGGDSVTLAVARGGRLQETLDLARARLAIPGVSATIILPDGSIWSGASGLADVARKTPVTDSTAFAFASISKTFTSALILELAAEGMIVLDAPAVTYLPRLKLAVDRRISVAMLLDHTSGLDDFFLNPKIDKVLQSTPTRVWTAADALAYVRKPLFPPGTGWHYSNTNYVLLGLIAEHVTGDRMADLIRARFLDPLRLEGTWTQVAERARTGLAHGYRFVGTKRSAPPIDLADGTGIAPFRSVVTAAGAAGDLAGTSRDLARWARELYSGAVLGPQTSALLFEGFNKTVDYEPRVAYGFGVQALVIDGRPSFGHSGRLLGFRGAVRHLSADGLTIAVLTNQSRADPGEIVRLLVAAATAPPPNCACPTPR
jgi:D-alanyl-D-alanine carboxypeptidase